MNSFVCLFVCFRQSIWWKQCDWCLQEVFLFLCVCVCVCVCVGLGGGAVMASSVDVVECHRSQGCSRKLLRLSGWLEAWLCKIIFCETRNNEPWFFLCLCYFRQPPYYAINDIARPWQDGWSLLRQRGWSGFRWPLASHYFHPQFRLFRP